MFSIRLVRTHTEKKQASVRVSALVSMKQSCDLDNKFQGVDFTEEKAFVPLICDAEMA